MVAGNETTRNAIAHGLQLFTDHPDQRELLLDDFDGRVTEAVEEIVRYATPVIQFRRTLTRDHEMNGQHYTKGDKVLLFYTSANRDEAVFRRPGPLRHHPRIRTRTSASAVPARTSAWAPTWPAGRSP